MTRIFVTDCEGPLTTNDNALELAERFIPDGGDFFARLSRYDDFLADVVRKPGYNAGDTLRLLPPFLKAYEVTDEDVEQFSAERVLMVPGALQMLLTGARAHAGFHHLHVLHAVHPRPLRPHRLPRGARALHGAAPRRLGRAGGREGWLREQAERVLDRELIDIPEDAAKPRTCRGATVRRSRCWTISSGSSCPAR